MALTRKSNKTKTEIIASACRLFLQKGFTNTTAKEISDSLGISTGNLTFYFPTKEHLLAVLAEKLAVFQQTELQHIVGENESPLFARCLELAAMASVCEENEVIRDFYLSVYRSPMALAIIRKTDSDRSKTIFKGLHSDWLDADYRTTGILASGIEYATLMVTETESDLPLEKRIAASIYGALILYGISAEERHEIIRRILKMDYSSIGRNIITEFTNYIEQENDRALRKAVRAVLEKKKKRPRRTKKKQ